MMVVLMIDIFCQDLHEVSPVEGIVYVGCSELATVFH